MTPGRAGGADDEAPRRRRRAIEGASRVDRSTRVLAVASGKGGVGKSIADRRTSPRAFSQLGQRVGVLDADVYGHSIPHMLGIHQRPVVVDKMIVPPVQRRPEADVDRLLPRRQRAGDVARADAAPRARAVPLRRALGRARRCSSSTCRRAPATSRSRSASCCRAPRSSIVTTPQPLAQEVASRAARDGAEDEHAPDRRDREHDLARCSAPAAASSSGRIADSAPRWQAVALDARLREGAGDEASGRSICAEP